jgi:hypothetical protein
MEYSVNGLFVRSLEVESTITALAVGPSSWLSGIVLAVATISGKIHLVGTSDNDLVVTRVYESSSVICKLEFGDDSRELTFS